jgi:dihydrofolate synthase / folylpolyglutamate synthase
MIYKEALEYLDSYNMHKIDLGLNDIKSLLNKLNNPHTKFKSIHIAGTNGKGSVAAMLSKILQKAGYKVGLYTSPHLISVNERIKVNDKNIPNITLSKYLTKLKPTIKRIEGITYFEILTALTFLYFAEKKVDYAIIETGLGGRLDATNILSPEITAITNVSLEHTKYLGNTIKQIAREKAGIIKPHTPIVTAAKNEALEIIKKTATKNRAQLIIAKPLEYECNLKGDFQRLNVGIAAEISYLLKIPEETIKESLKEVNLQARLQFLKHNILIDSAHNPSATQQLANDLKKANESTTNYYDKARLLPEYRKLILVFGILNTKDYQNTLKPIAQLASKIILTKPLSNNAQDTQLLAQCVKTEHGKDFIILNDIKEAVIYAQQIAQKNDLILVTGSFYLVGEVLRLFSQNL